MACGSKVSVYHDMVARSAIGGGVARSSVFA
jgi:hypothetical protein